jgi:putative spermidine/putrescine transport system permease protein
VSEAPASRTGLLILPAAAYLAALYLFPILSTLRLSFGSPAALASFADVFTSRSTWIVFRQTFEMAIVVTACSLLVGYPIAYLLVRLSPAAQRVIVLLVLLPYWISTLVRSYAWIAILGRRGVVNSLLLDTGLATQPVELLYNRLGATIGMVNVVAPMMILVLYAAFARIDLELTRIGSVLGGRPLFVFGRIWLPLSAPGIWSGCILVFLVSLGVFTTPAILGGSTEMSVAMAIEQQVGTLLDLPAAAALSTLLLAVTLLMLVTTQRIWVPALLGDAVQRRRPAASTGTLFDRLERFRGRKPVVARAVSSGYWSERRSGRRRLLWVVCAASIAYLLIPVIVVIGLSFSSANFLQFPPRGFSLRWFQTFFQSPEWVGAAGRSFIVALMTTAIATIVGTAVAYGMERGRVRYRRFHYLLLLSPLVIPPMILAFGLYSLYAKLGWIGSLSALALAHVVIVLPFVFITVSQGLKSIDPAVEFAGSSLGGKPAYVFRRITLPLLRPAVISGGLLAFLTSFDELIIALFLTSPRSATLPKRMWDSVRFEIDPTNAAAATLLIGLSVLVVSLSLFSYRRALR